jgi:hypothetical protein
MSIEQSSGSQGEEKPASQMSVEELQALLATKQAEQQPAAEEEADMSYVEMAGGESSSTMSPEAQETIAEQIAEAEGELKTNLAEMEEAGAQAEEAFTQAEEALEADPNALNPKVVLEKIRDVFDRANNKMIEISGGLLIGGIVGGGAGMGMMAKGQSLEGTDQNYINMATDQMTAYDWSSLGEQVATASTWGSMAAIAATYTFAKMARRFKEKQAKSTYFASQTA